MDAASVRALSLEELAREVGELRSRVELLERQACVSLAPAVEEQTAAPLPLESIPSTELGEAFPVIGRALLGVAGAYLLRALTELGAISPQAGVAAGFLYAAAWLYVAAQTAPSRKFAAALAALTSAGILGPLLYESLQRFHAISSWTAAGVIVAFAWTTVALFWNRAESRVPMIVTACMAVFSLALLVAMRDLLPFTLALLAVAAAVEFAACFERETTSRPFLGAAADTALIICTYLAASPGGLPDSYAGVSAPAILAVQLGLLIIYVASTAARTIVAHRPFTNFETIQTAAAFVIGLGGALRMASTTGAGAGAIGGFALLGGAACYVVAFLAAGGEGRGGRNFHTYSTFAILLALAGSFLLLPGIALIAFWALLALVCLWIGMRTRRHILGVHAAVTLALAWILSGVAMQPRMQFFGQADAAVPGGAEAIVLLTVLLAYAVVVRTPAEGGAGWDDRLAAAVMAVILTWSLAGITAHGLVLLSPELAPVWGTVVLVVVAAFLAVMGVEWKRQELRWLVFAFMTVAGFKLITEDLRQKHTLALVVSLLLYGGMLILLPRLLRQDGRRESRQQAAGI